MYIFILPILVCKRLTIKHKNKHLVTFYLREKILKHMLSVKLFPMLKLPSWMIQHCQIILRTACSGPKLRIVTRFSCLKKNRAVWDVQRLWITGCNRSKVNFFLPRRDRASSVSVSPASLNTGSFVASVIRYVVVGLSTSDSTSLHSKNEICAVNYRIQSLRNVPFYLD